MNYKETIKCSKTLKEVKKEMFQAAKTFGRDTNGDDFIDKLDKIYDKIDSVSKILDRQVKMDKF